MTWLIGRKRVSKSHIMIEACGTMDELISFIGLLRDQHVSDKMREELIHIQDKLMVCSSLIAAEGKKPGADLPRLYPGDITHLEEMADEMEGELTPLQNFLLPGGHSTISFCHIARNVCRRAERSIIRLNQEEKISSLVISYVNRLSDVLFVMARKLSMDLGIKEEIWRPNK